jgi:hypothetical protein
VGVCWWCNDKSQKEKQAIQITKSSKCSMGRTATLRSDWLCFFRFLFLLQSHSLPRLCCALFDFREPAPEKKRKKRTHKKTSIVLSHILVQINTSSTMAEELARRLLDAALERTAAQRVGAPMTISRMYFSEIVPLFDLSQEQ